ncbi:phenylalanine--tRNA ligase beta subunit [Pilimelia terevasa]|uniref:Phenylalanine--tRNA ligase beta subunit n=1 Tax=Pilimelia terevasa TaxID=53372 RepID=A0A8J3BSQ2_9ACTN|nr:phenylalanine--tRNA ligase subunit beta [Pilimelia terevasa]GGK34765.1 phenylalanine--tRNA ligase beta subunit [Pilimelia terevasa]
MKISLDWVRDYVDLPADLDIKTLAHDLTLKTVEVEAWTNPSERLHQVVVTHVSDVVPLGDKGVRLTCDIGTGTPLSVASRVTDLMPGRVLALALPGARLTPRGGDQFREVAVPQVMGIDSQGVLVCPADLGVQNLFAGGDTALLDAADLDVPAGTALAEAIGYDDWVLEIDNKSLTNRPDLWGHYGIARELAAIYGLSLNPLPTHALPPATDGLLGDFDPALCRRFLAVSFDLDQLGPAPLWMRSRLARIGENPRNLCVDLTNYVMLAVGQPTHVYDADGITTPLGVRAVDAPIKVDLIAGHTRELDPGTPIVTDANGPVAVAGVIGGAASAVTDDSRHFVLEVANFLPQPIRRASQRLGIRTEGSARFEKDLDTPRVDAATGLFLRLLTDTAPDVRLHASQDVAHTTTNPATVATDLNYLSTRIGQPLSAHEVARPLEALGFQVLELDGHLQVTAPTWRSTGDISGPHDIIEEVARIRGYDTIPTAGLAVALRRVRDLNAKPLDRVVREQLARAGLREVVTYPWTSDALLAATGHDKQATVRIEGAPAPDRDSLRPSLIPGLLEAVASNLRYRSEFGVYEVGTVFRTDSATQDGRPAEHLPPTQGHVAAALTGSDGVILFRRAKGILDSLARHAHLTDLDLDLAPGTDTWADQSARLAIMSGRRQVGTLGLLTNRVRRTAGIDVHVAAFEINLGALTAYTTRENAYRQLPEHPDSEFDLSVVVSDTVTWHGIAATTRAVGPPVHSVAYLDEFRGEWVPADHRSLSLRVAIQVPDRTPTADDIGRARQKVLDALATNHGARLRES